MNRTENILAIANSAEMAESAAQAELTEIDTSSLCVPIGSVSIARKSLSAADAPDRFWASCIAADPWLDLRAAVIEPLAAASLETALQLLQHDLERAGATLKFDLPHPAQVLECFTLAHACHHCVGQTALLRTGPEAFYVHWHRQS